MRYLQSLKYASLCSAFLVLMGIASCTEDHDNPKYTSRPPSFSHVEVKSLDGDSVLRAGKKLVVTAIQSTKGKLIYKAEYKWGNKKGEARHQYTKEVIYDLDPVNPSDTVVFTTPGTYTMTLNAKYHISGNYENINGKEVWEDGSVNYSTPSWMYYLVDIEKKIRVQ